MHNPRGSASGPLALIAATLAWGISFSVAKRALESIPVIWLLALRFLGAFFILLLIALVKKKLRGLTVKEVLDGLFLGFMLFCSYMFQTYGLEETTPGRNAFLTALYTVATPFLGWILGRTRPDRYNLLAAVLCFAGVGFLSLEPGSLSFRLGHGDVLTIVSGVFFAAHIVMTSDMVEKYDLLRITILEFLSAGVLALCVAPFADPLPRAAAPETWLAVVYLSIVCTALCFYLQNYAERHTSPSTTAVLLSLEAVFGIGFSLLCRLEPMTVYLGVGFALIFVAILISETKLSFLRKPGGAD